jgi:hypothetical protein
MMKKNEKIILSGEEAISVLKEINLILISLHKIGSYYIGKEKVEYERETNRFIDDWKVTQRLAEVRKILTEKFDLTLGEDDMERALDSIKYWFKPGDNPRT